MLPLLHPKGLIHRHHAVSTLRDHDRELNRARTLDSKLRDLAPHLPYLDTLLIQLRLQPCILSSKQLYLGIIVLGVFILAIYLSLFLIDECVHRCDLAVFVIDLEVQCLDDLIQ